MKKRAITPPKPKNPNVSKRKRDSQQRPGVNSKAKPPKNKNKIKKGTLESFGFFKKPKK